MSCLCKGTGGKEEIHKWGIKFIPCPDSHCTFDRDKARREYEQWSAKLHRKINEMRLQHVE